MDKTTSNTDSGTCATTNGPRNAIHANGRKRTGQDYPTIVWGSYILLGLGLAATVLWIDVRNALTGLIWALACFVSGGALGFIFGIPKVLQQAPQKQPGESKTGASNSNRNANYRQEVNTNLTEISDWLTKMIVGVGLVNLKEIPPLIKNVALVLANGMAKSNPGRDFLPYAVGVIVFFIVLGFLFGYLMTRLYLAPAFARADIDAQALSLTLVKGELAPIETAVSLLTDSLETRPANDDAKSRETGRSKMAGSPSAEDQALAAAQTSFDASSIPDEKKRVAAKDAAANEIARLVLRKGITKDWLVERAREQAVDGRQDGFISGLAIAITISPDDLDFDRLFRVAPLCRWPNAQHKVCVAIAKLYSAGFGVKQEVPDVVKLLRDFLRRGADEPLKRRINETAAVITRITGVPISLPE
jgi:hypothetical protein